MVTPALAAGYYWTSRTQAPPLPPGVRKEVRQLTLANRPVSVALYYPPRLAEAPLVVVAHGFSRSKRYMAGWGCDLAREGFITAVLTQPALTDHRTNSQAIADLAALLNDSATKLAVKPSGRTALMGHSMGGLTTFLATVKQPVDAWIGLDPVGMDGSWLKPAKTMHMPCLVLRAEPGAWNLKGNARKLFAELAGPKISVKVRGAGHLDPENPTDVLGQLACGSADEARRAIFRRYAVAFAKAYLLDDAGARRVLEGAGDDPSLTEVENHLRVP